MSSMTDVVFLLLIFFMIASTLAKQLNTIDVKLPQAKGKTENRSTVAVTIDRSGAFFIDDKKVAKARLQPSLIAQLTHAANKSVVLRASENVAIEEVVYVMNIANQNGIKIVLAVDAQ